MSDTNTPAASTGSRTPLLAIGGVVLVGLGVAAGMFLRTPSTPSPEQAASAPVAVASAASAEAASAPVAKAEEHKAEAAKSVRHRERAEQRVQPAPTAQVCATCGTVDSVRAVTQKGEGSGVGAVAGGVIGGLVGNQMGKGSGKTAMTVLGAIGGGIAGNEIEKNQHAATVYEVTVRMDDGSYRTVTQSTAPAAGSRVQVEGNTLSPLNR